MKSYLIFIPIFLLALFQGAFLSLNLVLLTVLFFTAFVPDKRGLWVAFGGGLLLDLVQGTSFGLSALIFLILTFLLILYSHRFEPTHWLFLSFFVFVSAIVYSLIVWRQINWGAILVLVFLTLIVLFILRFFPIERRRSLKLRS
jgi:rod shape-determining protein MreD